MTCGDTAINQLKVPTYYGQQHQDVANAPDFAEPFVPVSIGHADGVRLLLGTTDWEDDEMPDIQIERRPHGWAIFIHPNGGDAAAYIYMLDNGRTFMMPEHWVDPPIATVWDIPPEVDQK